VVKLTLKWLFPLAMTGLLLTPNLVPFSLNDDPVTITSNPPSRSALLSNRYTQLETDDRVVDANAFADLTNYQYRGTIGTLSFYDQTSNASFRLVDERSGYIWASSINYDYFLEENSPLADEADVGLNLYWQNKLRSPFFLTYYNGLNLREEHAFENVRSKLTAIRISTATSVGMEVSVELFLSKIQFTYTIMLTSEGLAISLPQANIIETDEFKLSSISFYPLFGATKRLRTPGYVVIPDGVGALIRYTDDPTMGVFSKRFFGGDLGLNQARTEQPLFANMYGLVHGHRQHAMLATVTDGAGHGILTHYGSQVFLDFNFTYVTFNYRNTYLQYLNQSKTSSVSLLQQTMNPIDVHLTYQFLTGDQADYVGIARAYGQTLFGTRRVDDRHPTIPLHLDVLALESKPGLFTREKVVMTTLNELKTIVADVSERTSDHLYLAYLGWQRGGYSYTAPNFTQWDPSLGSTSTLQQWVSDLPEATTFMLGVDPYRAYRQGSGYRQQDIMQSIGQEFIYQGAYYYLQAEVGTARFMDAVDATASWGISHLALETVGTFASSHFGRQAQSKEGMIDTLHQVIDEVSQTAVYQPFSYLWHGSALLDMPMYSSQQARFTDTVPLLPIMVNGHQHAFGRAGNFFSNTTNELLRMVDYGYYPAFFITEASAYALMDTPSGHIFTSRYQDWASDIQRQYDFIAEGLRAVYGQTILAREVLSLGVVKITYESGTAIVVNYSGTPYTSESLTVPAMAYEVIHA